MKAILAVLGADYKKELAGERLLSTPRHYAYLKISEGCDRACSYCAIPLIRGKHISRPVEELIEEARILASKGVKELILIAQDLTYYGMDLYGRRRLSDLVRGIAEVDGIEWIRLHYAYPNGFPEDVLEVMASEPKVCKYLDIPLQHISDRILKSMKRGSTKEQINALLDKIREKVPGSSAPHHSYRRLSRRNARRIRRTQSMGAGTTFRPHGMLRLFRGRRHIGRTTGRRRARRRKTTPR